jgi:hypothetical protein
MKNFSPTAVFSLVVAFTGGFSAHFLYQRWNSPGAQLGAAGASHSESPDFVHEPKSHTVSFAPLTAPVRAAVELPLVPARDVDRLRAIVGSQARVRGRIFRVGHSAKSNTYFLNFGPSREALTGVIFASGVELFEKGKLAPKGYEGKEVEIEGVVKDHPQFGLEVIIENPTQIRLIE